MCLPPTLDLQDPSLSRGTVLFSVWGHVRESCWKASVLAHLSSRLAHFLGGDKRVPHCLVCLAGSESVLGVGQCPLGLSGSDLGLSRGFAPLGSCFFSLVLPPQRRGVLGQEESTSVCVVRLSSSGTGSCTMPCWCQRSCPCPSSGAAFITPVSSHFILRILRGGEKNSYSGIQVPVNGSKWMWNENCISL